MKLITLNIWGGHIRNPLLKFIQTHQEVDIFCFQEVYHKAKEKISTEDRSVDLNIFGQLQKLLPNHHPLFRPVVENIYGIGMFVKKGIDILGEGEVCIYENPNYPGRGPTHSRNMQWLECSQDEKTYSIFNVHGLWNGKGKTDSPERLSQAKRIRDFLDTINSPKILCGDFNLRPDTESIKIIEKEMRNLIREHKVVSTRTSLYPKEERYADYIFTSNDVLIKRFEVLKDEVSDHAPLLVEFN